MLKKYLSKFTIDILPSILATIVGAYIVNHYIVPKARDDRPAASAAAIPASKSPESKASDIVDAPDTAPAKPRTVDKGADKPAVEKASIDKSETANAPSEPRRHQPAREKAVAKVTPAPVTPAAVAPALATVGTATTSDDERRDANGLARAAIERLNRSEPRVQDVPRASEAPRAPEAPRVQEVMRTAPTSPSMPQLPPPISVATPNVEKFDSSPAQAERSDSRRFRPPGEIPAPLPMDLQANAAAAPKPERTNVAEDVLSAAKSVFNSVIPHPFER